MDPRLLLFENHLEFIATHRGPVRRHGDTVLVESERPEFCYAAPGRESWDPSLLDRFNVIHQLPWAPEALPHELARRGYHEFGGLTYQGMVPDTQHEARPDVDIRVVSNAEEMDLFTEIQCTDMVGREDARETWYAWYRAANQRNLANPTQTFYVATIGGSPAGVLMRLQKADIAGIYFAVTSPEHRKKGVYSSMVARACADAREADCSAITGQVSTGSSVLALDMKLGLKPVFRARIYRR
ncbi:GNAT family N-acetyltransferase [Corallococcus silvisoli]|uniref:GNAT family N-acetyltransferase n=1 Tax=Corallococcus silvisoli TaxID=2697031 RepID=UPI001378D500|nr:GNAT family N-acetyltransferase [Corallococcus silvisoli]NBD12960.1 GNAT family N-acetyltransferase [Corallococcus silvisoli]